VAAGSFAGIFAIAAARLPPDTHPVAGGIINAGGSVGQFLYAPLIHLLTHIWSYCASLLALAGFAVAAILPSWVLCRTNPFKEDGGETATAETSFIALALLAAFVNLPIKERRGP
jgi:predicted MFS family arabinose efflux permease